MANPAFETQEELLCYLYQYKDDFYRLAYGYVKNEQDALDVVSDSLYKASSYFHTLQNKSYAKTWFYRIVVNTSIDFLRRRKRSNVVDEDIASLPYHDPDSVELVDLRNGIDRLAPKFKTVIILRFFEDLKLEEIAQIQQCSINTVKSRLYAALRKLKLDLTEDTMQENGSK
ncbi:RNA polymerase sigma factor [Feifania hominis]|uniref:Sigma-70 family RNA polymerase sigma factor n=1 Tax=Feifania hominis TaxID=2763660 RepID=A0A926DE26_9FIRM|nr:sigma-70 family RNA polymerase sigma factor [Feifania hominis]MBC8536109.1 sigma-70 family RNA polymerase sigma factor [Feifania hominis]